MPRVREHVANRVSEPSTHAGAALLAQVAKAVLPPQYHMAADIVAGLFATLAVTLPERK